MFSKSAIPDEFFSDLINFRYIFNDFHWPQIPNGTHDAVISTKRNGGSTLHLLRASWNQGPGILRTKRTEMSDQSLHARAFPDVQTRRSHCAGRQAVRRA